MNASLLLCCWCLLCECFNINGLRSDHRLFWLGLMLGCILPHGDRWVWVQLGEFIEAAVQLPDPCRADGFCWVYLLEDRLDRGRQW